MKPNPDFTDPDDFPERGFDVPAVEAIGRSTAQPEVLALESFLTQRGAGRSEIGDAGMHKRGRNQTGKMWDRIVDRQALSDAVVVQRRHELRAEYESLVAAGSIRPPTKDERLAKVAQGHPDNPSVQAARRVLERRSSAMSVPAVEVAV